MRAGGGAEGGAGRPACREHVGRGRPQSEPARGPPGWVGRGCPPAPDRARAWATCVPWGWVRGPLPGGDPYLGTLPARPEEGGWHLQRLRGACRRGARLPSRSPPRALGPVWVISGEARLDSATRGRRCAGRVAGGQHSRGLAHSGAVRASWARSQGLGLLPHRRSLQARRGPGGGPEGRCVWQPGRLPVCRHPGSRLSHRPPSQEAGKPDQGAGRVQGVQCSRSVVPLD